MLAGITLAMAMLPEEFPVVLTIFLALGAWRISQKRVLTRRVPAVETLGAATVLCVDKTGTLTLNQMSVSQLYAGGQSLDVTPVAAAARCRSRSTRCSSSASSPATRIRSTRWSGRSQAWASRRSPTPNTCTATGRWCRSIRCRSELLAMSHVWQSPAGA